MARKLLILAVVVGLYMSGCLSESENQLKDDKTAVAPSVNETLPKVETEDFMLQASFATSARSFNNGGPVKLMKPGGNITGFMVEVAWKPVNQASERMSVWIRKEGDGAVSPNNPTFLINSPPPLKQVDGASPIKVPLPIDVFKGSTDNFQVYLRSSAAPVGATVNQPGKLYLTTFEGVPFNATFSAIPK